MKIAIHVVETIHYDKTYELAQLEEYAGVTLEGDCEGDLQAFIEAVHEEAHRFDPDNPGFAEDLERFGDVQGQVWSGVITKETTDGH